jgi:hypothetical protein
MDIKKFRIINFCLTPVQAFSPEDLDYSYFQLYKRHNRRLITFSFFINRCNQSAKPVLCCQNAGQSYRAESLCFSFLAPRHCLTNVNAAACRFIP